MKSKSLKTIFYSLIVVFVLILAFFVIPFSDPIRKMLFPLAGILLIFLILGVMLAIIARKETSKLKLFLMLTGISAVAPLVFTILHNLFYGLAITFQNFKYLFEALHVASFLISLVIAPIAFIVGIIGSIVFFRKNNIDIKKQT